MILPEDSDFHAHDPSLTMWTETIGFWFAIPEEEIYGNIYVLARPEVGATISSINVIQGLNELPYTADFTDAQMHVPCPPSMADFTLTSGLSAKVVAPPTDYDFSYSSIAGTCSFDMKFRGIMPAWDPNDPNENPLVQPTEETDLGLGDAWAGGHLDYVGRTTGSLTLRGKTYEFDSMSGMDRSWGTRTELGKAAISYMHIPFGDDLAFHLVTGVEVQGDTVTYGPLRFGYVHDNGTTYGITEARMSGREKDLLPMEKEIEIVDSRGHRYHIRCHAIAGAPWYTFSPSYVAMQSLMEYELDGRIAHGLMSDTYGVEFLASRTSRYADALKGVKA